MDRAERKRRAAVAAMALLEWRARMAKENAARENADHEMELRFFIMLAEMRVQADEFWKRGTSKTALISAGASASVHSNGAAGAL